MGGNYIHQSPFTHLGGKKHCESKNTVQEHNKITPVKAPTQITRFVVQHASHRTTAQGGVYPCVYLVFLRFSFLGM